MRRMTDLFFLTLKITNYLKRIIYLPVPSLICGMQDLKFQLVGSGSLTRDQTLGPLH